MSYRSNFIPLTLLALLAGCTSETFNTESLDNEFVSHVTITASDFVIDDASRTSLELTSSGLSFTWAESDVVGIFPNAGDQVKFPMTKGAGTKTANFDGGGWALKGNYTYAAYYPFSKENYDRSYTALPISYKGQKQPANNSTAGLGAYDYMVATASTPESGNVTFNFSHIGSVLYLQLTTPDAATFTKLTLSSDSPIFTTEATVNISDATLTTISLAKAITLNLDDIAVEAGGTLYAWLLIAPTDASGKALTATLTTSASDTYTVEHAGMNYLTGKAYQLKGDLTESGTGGTGGDIGWGDEIVLNGHEYVDLGLPSGTLWATCNIGANTPEEYGNYFAWGEVLPKTNYSLDTYLFSSEADAWESLDLEHDAANYNWGGNWRIPTKKDFSEIYTNCTRKVVTQKGVLGLKFTSKTNGNSVFFPAAGCMSGTSHVCRGEYCMYRSTIAREVFEFYCGGYADQCDMFDNYIGISVRPVLPPMIIL